MSRDQGSAPKHCNVAVRRGRWRLWLPLVLLPVIATGAWAGGLVGLALQILSIRSLAPDPYGGRLALGSYQVGIEGSPIAGLSDNTSGLTYSAATGTLFTAINSPPALAELSAAGHLLRKIPLTGASDVEGVTHVEGDRFIIIDEGNSRLNWITIGAGTTAIDLTGTPFITLDLGSLSNLGFEGISWDQSKRRLVVVQEMLPVRVLMVDGLEDAVEGRSLNIALHEWKPQGWAGHAVSDLSSVTAHDPTGNMILLSHMSSVLIEYDAQGAPLSLLSLWAGQHGLQGRVPQAEGVAIGPAGEVFVVSEPNLFYRFDPPGGETRP